MPLILLIVGCIMLATCTSNVDKKHYACAKAQEFIRECTLTQEHEDCAENVANMNMCGTLNIKS